MVIFNFSEIRNLRDSIGLLNFRAPVGFISGKSDSTAAFRPPDFPAKIHTETEDPGRAEIRAAFPIFISPSVEGVPNLMRLPRWAKPFYALVFGSKW